MWQKTFLWGKWSILAKAWEQHMFSASFRSFWKAGWEQPLPPSWAMNISYFRISNRLGGAMIKRLPRVTTHSPVLFPKKPCCQSVVICLVKDVMCWNVAAVVWENTKNNFPLEMYWIFFVYQIRNLGLFFRSTSFHVSMHHWKSLANETSQRF